MKGNRERAPLYGKDFPVRFEPPRQVQQGRFFSSTLDRKMSKCEFTHGND